MRKYLTETIKKGGLKDAFKQYSDTMFSQLLHYCKYTMLQKGGILYEKDKPCDDFYVLINGEVGVNRKINEDESINASFVTGSMFGFGNQGDEVHDDFATAKLPCTIVLEIPTFIYKEIIKQTELDIANKKIDFLLRFGPAFRSCELELIQQYEQYFQKEEAT